MREKPVTQELKEIREGAGVGIREMARRLGVSPNSYTHYENPERFKDPYLPMHQAERFADALAQSGVAREAVLALAGALEPLNAEALDARLSRLPPSRRQKVLQYLADQEALEAQGKQEPGVDG